MIVEALIEAEPYIHLPGAVGRVTMSQAIHDMVRGCAMPACFGICHALHLSNLLAPEAVVAPLNS